MGLPLSFFDDVSDLSPKANIQAFNMEKAKIKKYFFFFRLYFNCCAIH